MSSLSVAFGQIITTSTSVSGTDDVAVAAGGTISVSTAAPDILWSANATGGGVTIENDGTITQTGTGGSARPAIGANGVTGTLTLVNTGTISSVAGPALGFGLVLAGGSENITTSGIISGGNGVAIQFGAGNDTLTLLSGYSITGRVNGGAGNNTLNLSGAGGGSFRGSTEFGAGSTVTFAGFDNFNTLNVQSGAWTLYGGGYYDTINISAGATLIVDDHVNSAAHGNPNDGSFGPIGSTLTINIGGTLRLLNPATSGSFYFNTGQAENSVTGPIILAGSGGVEVSGSFAINPNATFTIAGGLTALDGLSLVLGSLNANVTVNAGAMVQIGNGGGSLANQYDGSTYVDPGNTGSITGNVLDNGTLKVDRLDSYTLGGALTGNGVLQKLASGVLTLQNSTNFTGHVLMDGGTLNLAGAVNFNQSNIAAVASSGLAGSGAVTIANGGTLVSQQSAAINMSAAPGNVALHNSGTISGGTSLPVNSQIAVILSNHDDTLVNSGVINGLVSLAGGNDVLDSHAGTINGAVLVGPGTSTVTLGVENNAVVLAAGVHTVNGGGGINSVVYTSAAAAVHVSLAQQGQAQSTGVGSDTLFNFQNLIGSNYDDTLEGDGHDNLLNGGGGTNTVAYSHAGSGVTVSLLLVGAAQNTVGAGSDTLSNFKNLMGSTFADVLTGDASNNAIDGGGGNDTLTGGLGADTFIYNEAGGQVVITDFSHAQSDHIDLSQVGVFNMSDVLALASQVGADTVASRGGDSLTLKNVSLASLTAGDFIFAQGGPTTGPAVGVPPTTAPASGGTVSGGASADWLVGQGGNDALHGGGGSDYLDGGPGLNTATYDGPSTVYTISPTGGTVSGGPEGGADTLVNIQRIQFVDGYLAISPTDTAGQVFRIYEATLNRSPDAVGLANWTHNLNSGGSLQSVVNGFVGSAEFQANYGSLDNAGFVTLLYQNVLHRAPDTGGLNNWLSYLSQGHTRAEVVLGFSESPEDIANLSAPIQQGVWIQDAAAAQVARLYDTVLARLPDLSGLANWTHNLNTGTSLQSAANGFVGSAEFQANYGALDNSSFVSLLYANVLHRAPDTGGLNNWLSYLSQGHTRAEVVLGFSESPEHIVNTGPHVDYGVWVA